jgi:hypothetical protein
VSVPIRSLLPYEGLVSSAQDSDAFRTSIIAGQDTRQNPEHVERRRSAARTQDYDIKFKEAMSLIHDHLPLDGRRPTSPGATGKDRLNILMLYDKGSTHVSTIREHLESFSTHSRHFVAYANATSMARCDVDLSIFDAVVIHYCVRLSLKDHLSPHYADELRTYPGLKVLFIQDEYDTTSTAWEWIRSLGIHLVFTCVPLRSLDSIYPPEMFRYVEFVQNLTGFVPQGLEGRTSRKPMKERAYTLGYRGRMLPYWYGTLGYEKFIIGERMRRICEERRIPADIECDDAKRIYGDQWYEFVENCRAVLGTESGSNVFDFHGTIRKSIEEALKEKPGLSFEEIHSRFLREHDGRIKMNQISPKIFEAIALKTALVLFEGEYSGIVMPDIHYIPLKKDFSNVDEVLAKLEDLDFLTRLTEKAHEDIIASGRYGYRSFVEDVDSLLSKRVPRGQKKRMVTSISGWIDEGEEQIHLLDDGMKSGLYRTAGRSNTLLSRHTVSRRSQGVEHILYLMISDLLPPSIKKILFPMFRPLKRWMLKER